MRTEGDHMWRIWNTITTQKLPGITSLFQENKTKQTKDADFL